MIRVMIVATHVEVREGLCMVLRLAGSLEVLPMADSLDSALRLARAEAPDVVLVDLEMAPGDGVQDSGVVAGTQGTGYEILRRLKRQCLGVKFIALTAHDYPAARASAVQAGADGVMVKGLAVTEMVAAIHSVVDGMGENCSQPRAVDQ